MLKLKQLDSVKAYPNQLLKLLIKRKEKTKNNTGLTLIFAINYGGRAEIIQSMKEIFEELQSAHQSSEAIDENLLNKHLMTRDYPDPELLIRTSGEQKN